MSQAEALGFRLPKLPELDGKDIEAVRSFLPGRLLGRMAALLSLVLVLLGFAGGVDQGLKRLIDVDLTSKPLLHFVLLFGLPLLAVGSQVVIEWRAEQVRRALQRLAVHVSAVPPGYFRIGPYLDTEEDRAKFDRADRAHVKVLDWVEHATDMPLYLIGDSGSGKTSLLSAFVLPTLRAGGCTVVEARTWQDPEAALRNVLAQLPDARRVGKEPNRSLRELIEDAAPRMGAGLLIVLDQFEEFVIVGDQERQQAFAVILANLRAMPVRGVKLLLVLRSDYQVFLDEIGLPTPRHGENLFQVARFAFPAASDFLVASGLSLQPDSLTQLLASAATMDETPGLVRPITLNVIGHVLATGHGAAASLDAGQLVRGYITQAVSQSAIRDRAPSILGELITEQATKRPRTEEELVAATNLRRGEVRAVLNSLAAAALARPLDAAQCVWELSHDFVARAVARYLGRRRRNLIRRAAAYTSPSLLAVTLLIGGSVIAWDRLSPYKIRADLAELGLTVTPGAYGLAIERNSRLTRESFAQAGPLMAKLIGVQSLNLNDTPVENLEPIKRLPLLQTLDLAGTKVENIKPIRGLIKLQSLKLTGTFIRDLEPLTDLTALQELDLSDDTQTENLEPLKNLTALRNLRLKHTSFDDLEPLKGLTALRSLDLSSTRVDSLEPLKGLGALQELDLSGDTLIDNLKPLKDLIALRSLNVSNTHVNDLRPLRGLAKLQSLNLSFTNVENLELLKNLTMLQTLDLHDTQAANLEPLTGLTALQTLVLMGANRVASFDPLGGLIALRELNLRDTRIQSFEPLRNLVRLTSLDLAAAAAHDLDPLKGLTALQRLDLSFEFDKLKGLDPLKHLSALQWLSLVQTRIQSLEPIEDLPALQEILTGLVPENEKTRFKHYRDEKRLLPVRM